MTRVLRIGECVFLLLGMALVCVYAGMRLYGFAGSRAAIAAFRFGATHSTESYTKSEAAEKIPGIDTSLWSEKRVGAYKATLTKSFGKPLALLVIPKIHLEVPVFEGTDDATLDRGVGRIVGAAHPGQEGNLGIAGHRDGFFRGLKDVTMGDEISLVLPNGVTTYVVDQIEVVAPEDVSVLQPRAHSSITLVTCFPFYFVGSAPQRYIVFASLRAEPNPADGTARPN